MGPFLGDVGEATRADFERGATRRSWPVGATLFREGDAPSRVFLLESGLVKVTVTTDSGGEAGLALKGPGDLVGELAAIDAAPRSATASVIRPVTAWTVSTGDFRAMLGSHADLALAVLRRTVDNLRGTSRRQAEFGSSDTTQRLARLLVDLAVSHGQTVGGALEVKLLSQDELAGFCSASRESVARSLRTLRDAGVIETGRKVVRIADVAALGAWSPEIVG